MRGQCVLILLILSATAATAQMCEQGAALSPAQVDAIAKGFELQYTTAFNEGDAKALAALYTENATVMAEYGAVQRGRTNIEKSLAGLFTSAYGSIEDAPTLSRSITNDVIVVQGTILRHRPASKQPGETAVYTHVLVQQDNEWHLAAVQYSIKAHIPNQSEFLKALNSKNPKSQ